jgi:predicted regulator of Ras-like GTPase activity (Roadblock/LC7/MglB family)
MTMTNQTSSKNNSELLQEILTELTTHNADILSALVISDEGLNVASGIPHLEDDSTALAASDLVDMAADFSKRLQQGKLNRILLEGEQRTTIILRAGKHTVLAVLIPADAKLGLIILSMRRAANQIAAVFE